MRKRGFTLIELLAVITILAIIALIAVPIVLNIIEDSKKSTAKESLELYGRAVENALANYFMKNPEEDDVSIGILESQNLIQYKGTRVSCDEVLIRNKQVYMSACKVGEEYIEDTYGDFIPMGTLVSDADNDGEISRGDKYKYKVNSEDEFNFYVLSIEGDKVNLIMDRNICEDGTVDYKKSNDNCKYSWHGNEQDTSDEDNNYGPDTAMTALYNATKNWYNVPDMIMNYIDENPKGSLENNSIDSEEIGYTSIITNKETKVTTIKGKQDKTSPKQTFGSTVQPLKSRLPKYNEVKSVGCEDIGENHEGDNTCPQWLIENLGDFSLDSSIHAGYWTLSSLFKTKSSNTNSSYIAAHVSRLGAIGNKKVNTQTYYGIRPVMIVLKSDLAK